MYLSRQIDTYLLSWKGDKRRKPMVVRGARQTGKSTTIRHLGEASTLFIELNFERFEDRELVRSCDGPSELLEAIALQRNLPALPPGTLLFLDEIQEVPRVISWLRFFYEDHAELAVICAGSLLEVRIAEAGFSFPVGRVTFCTLHPFSFTEFLWATERDVLSEKLANHADQLIEIPTSIDGMAQQALRDYALVGGMPEAVSCWRGTGAADAVERIHADLWQSLAEDIQKYRGSRDPGHLEAAFSSLKHHYGVRFKYENFAPGHKSNAMKSALDKLEGARIIARALPTTSVKVPLIDKVRSAPKLFPLDIGLASHSLGLRISAYKHAELGSVLDGRMAEIFVAQQLLGLADSFESTLHFWVRDQSSGNAELDFLATIAGRLIPIEVKAGATGALKSMQQFVFRAPSRYGVRFHTGGLKRELLHATVSGERLEYTLLSAPIYLAPQLSRLIAHLE